LLKGGDNVLQCCRVITKRENEADEITREVLTALRRTFITPLDRGDIKDLITSMDDAIDQMNQTAKTIALFELRSFDAPMQEMGEIIVRAAKLNVDAAALDTRLQIFSTPARRIRIRPCSPAPTRWLNEAPRLHRASRRRGSMAAGAVDTEDAHHSLIAAALMLLMPNAYAETQTASHMITTAAAITLYKIHCSGKIPASAVETVNTTIRGVWRIKGRCFYGRDRPTTREAGPRCLLCPCGKDLPEKINVRSLQAAKTTRRNVTRM
jgi:Protein of unknown function DUF47